MNHYDILGVKKTASQEEIKTAYKSLIKKYHPDLYQGDKTFAEKKSKEINIAYDVLSNPEKRSEYDLEITPQYESPTYDYTPPKYSNPSAYSYENYYRNKNASEFGDYNKRYTDYHRSKTPNSNYTYKSNMHENFSNSVINSVNSFSIFSKLFIILAIFLAYGAIFFFTVNSFNDFNEKGEPSTILNNNKETENTTNTDTDDYEYDTNYNDDYTDINDFNIYDYITEKELRDAYEENLSNSDISFEEYKQAVTQYIYYNFFANN